MYSPLSCRPSSVSVSVIYAALPIAAMAVGETIIDRLRRPCPVVRPSWGLFVLLDTEAPALRG